MSHIVENPDVLRLIQVFRSSGTGCRRIPIPRTKTGPPTCTEPRRAGSKYGGSPGTSPEKWIALRRAPGEMGFIGDQVESIRSMQVRQALAQIISLGDARSPIPSSLPLLFLHSEKYSPTYFALRSVGLRRVIPVVSRWERLCLVSSWILRFFGS